MKDFHSRHTCYLNNCPRRMLFIMIVILTMFLLGCSTSTYKKENIDLLHYKALEQITYEDNLLLRKGSLNFKKGWQFSPLGNGIWAVEQYADVTFHLLHPRTINLMMTGYSLNCDGKEQEVSLLVNNQPIKKINFTSNSLRRYIVPLEKEVLKDGNNSLQFQALRGCSPKSVGKGNDERLLYFFLSDLRIDNERDHDDLWKNVAFSFYLPYGTKHSITLSLGVNCTSTHTQGETTQFIIEKNNDGKKVILGNYAIICDAAKKKTLKVSVPLKTKIHIIPLVTVKIMGEGYGFSSPFIERCTIRYKEALAKKEKPNLLLFLFDALRYDHVSDNNYARTTTPTLDRIAKKATAFNKAYAQAPQTIGSVSSILTSRYPFWRNDTILDDRFTRLPEVLQKKGYYTALASQNPWVSKTFNMQKGFQEENEIANDKEFTRTILRTIVNAINRKGKFFIYIHMLEPHYPYLPPPQFYSRYAKNANFIAFSDLVNVAQNKKEKLSSSQVKDLLNQYDANITFGDYKLSEVISILKSLNLFDNNLFMIISSDHGEEFMDHGGLQHAATLYDEVIHVPLYIYYPALTNYEKKVDCPVELLDLTPTILDAAGLSSKEIASYGFDGKSLIPMIKEENNCTKKYAYSLIEKLQAYTVISSRYKFIQCKKGTMGIGNGLHKCDECFIELNAKEECRNPESTAVLKHREELKRKLENWTARELAKYRRQKTPQTPELSKEELEKLKALGYLR